MKKKHSNFDNEVKSYKWVKLKENPPKNAVLYVLDPVTKEIELFITDKNGVPRNISTVVSSINISDYVASNPNNEIQVQNNQLYVKKYNSGDEYINIVSTPIDYKITLNTGKLELLENKQDDLTHDGTGTKYPTVDAINEALSQIVPTPGKSAYEIALENGFVGTEQEWLESLKGEDGLPGVSPHIDPITGNWFIGTLDTGVKAQGEDGKSAYQLWLEVGNTGTFEDFLNSIRGYSAYEVAVINGFVGTEVQWLQSLIGEDGLSAYQLWLQQGNTGTVQDFLDSLRGQDGYTPIKGIDYFDGQDGESAYQIWLDLGNSGTEQDFINSLQGEDGTDGSVVTIGSNNNWYIDGVDTGIRAVGIDGQDGYTPIKGIDYFDGQDGYTPVKGIDYFDGIDGNTWYGGTNNPSSGLGDVGDWYVNSTTWDVFEKTGTTTWTLRGNIKGGKGDDGQDGIAGVISQVTANVNNTVGIPNVIVTLGGTAQNRTIHLDFQNLKGEKGEDGRGIRIVGTLPNPGALPTPPANTDDSYLIDGDLWVWDIANNTWVNVGNIQGPAGPPGPANSLSIGTVVSGATASATITGTAPSQTLNLVLPKGDNAPTYSATNGIQLNGTVFSPVYGNTVGTIAQGDDPRFHNAVTIGTANGLSLSNQVLSLGLASATSTGALSQADWIAFNSKASANNGNITYSGTGAIVGGGTSSANQSANTTYTFDLSQVTKDNIDLGVIANSWGDHSTFNYATQTWVTSNFAQIAHTHLTSHITALTGYTLGTNSPLTTSDTLNQALGKLQAQINSKGGVISVTAGAGLSGGTITSSGTIALNSATIASLNLANSALQSGDNISELINDAGYITSASIPIYTAGTGISISPSYVITNTAPNINQTLSFVGGVLTLSNGGGSVTIPNDNTITRLRGTATGTYTSGDLTLLAGTNITITQSGANFTIASTNTTYGGGTLAQLNASTPDSTNRVWSPSILNQWLNGKGYLTTETDPIFTASPAFGITSGDITNWNGKQDALVAGANITINPTTNVISATNTNTITRLRGTTSGTYTSGDLTLLAGTGIGIAQSGANITITNSAPNIIQTLSQTGQVVTLSNGGGSFTLPTPNTGTVTSVAMTTPTGLTVTGSPITSSGTLALTYASGYQGYTTTEANKLAGLSNYVLPIASATVLGGVRIGSGLNINASGVLSNSAPNVTQVLGLSGNTLSLSNGGGSVTLPTHTDTVTRLGTATGNLTSGDILVVGAGSVSTSKSGNTITLTGLNQMQNLVIGNTSGDIGINLGGNVVNIRSLGLVSRPNANINPYSGGGLIVYDGGATNYPSTVGTGLTVGRGVATGSFDIWKANTADGKVKLRADQGSWENIATEPWVLSQIPTLPTNFITTNTNQTGLSGNKTTSGVWTFNNNVVINSTITNATGLHLTSARQGGFSAYFENTDTGTSSNGLYVKINNNNANNTVQRWVVGSNEVGRVEAHTGYAQFNGFSKTGATNADILLGSGGHRPVSDFALAGSLGNYLPLAGGTSNSMLNYIDFSNQTNSPNTGLTLNGVHKLRFSPTATVLASNITGSTQGIYFRPQGHGVSAGQVTIDGNGQINTANHGNSSQWNHEQYGFGVTGILNTPDFTDVIATTRTSMKLVEGTFFGITSTNRPVGVLAKGVTNTRWSWLGVTDLGAIRIFATNSSNSTASVEVIHSGNINTFLPAIPTVNNGLLTISTSADLTGGGTFGANQATASNVAIGLSAGTLASLALANTAVQPSALSGYVPTGRTLTINGTTFDLSQNRTWTIPDNDTITRLRGTATGTYTSGDLTLLAGSNVSITQSGDNITISATNTNTTYTAGTGISIASNVITNTAPNATHTGDVTGSTALTIANGVVTNAKLANMPANTFKGRLSSAGAPQDLTVAQMQSILGISGSSGIESIRTDNSSSPGPAYLTDLFFNFHEYWGFPAAFAEETQPGNATAKATDGQLDFFASYDSVQTVVEDSGAIDLELKGYHITNVLLMSNGGDVSIEDGIYAGNQVNITTIPGYQINIYANNLISTAGNEVFSFANLIWDCDLNGWVLVAYGTP